MSQDGSAHVSAVRFPPGRLHALRAAHEPLARRLAVALTNLARDSVEVSLRSVERVPCDLFTFGRPRPTCLAVLESGDNFPSGAVEISPALLQPLVDRLLGLRQPDEPVARPLSSIEMCLAARVVAAVIEPVRHFWRLENHWPLRGIETDARLAALAAPDEPLLVWRFQAATPWSGGELNLCLAAKDAAPLTLPGLTDEPSRIAPSGPESLPEVTVSIELPPVAAPDELLASLQPGDVIPTAVGAGDPLLVRVAGIARHHARLEHDGSQATVHIDRPVEEPSPLPGDRLAE